MLDNFTIQKHSPRAYMTMKLWLIDTLDNEQSFSLDHKTENNLTTRLLYDFFDAHNLNIEITPEYYADGINWNWQIKWYMDKINWKLESKENYGFMTGTMMYGDNNEYPERINAEEAAITKAFELMEKRLNGLCIDKLDNR